VTPNISITFYFSCVELLVSMMPSTEARCHPRYARAICKQRTKSVHSAIRVGSGDLLRADPLLPMALSGLHLLCIPSVLDVDVDPPVGVYTGQ
jgi:hypothetical protein